MKKNRVEILKFKSKGAKDAIRLPEKEVECVGTFCCWATDHDDNLAPIPVAIVKLKDGSVRSVFCEMIRFI